MSNIINLVPFFKRKTFLNRKFYEAWDLHDKYVEKYESTRKMSYLEKANKWAEVGFYLGNELDKLGGSL